MLTKKSFLQNKNGRHNKQREKKDLQREDKTKRKEERRERIEKGVKEEDRIEMQEGEREKEVEIEICIKLLLLFNCYGIKIKSILLAYF